MREAAADFTDIVRANRSRFPTGVVHSFTGSREEAMALVAEGTGFHPNSDTTTEKARLRILVP